MSPLLIPRLLPGGASAEVLDAGLQVGVSERLETTGGKRLASEGCKDGPLDDGLAQDGKIVRRRAVSGEVAGNAAEEGVARTGGIGNGLKRVSGTAEEVERRRREIGDWGLGIADGRGRVLCDLQSCVFRL